MLSRDVRPGSIRGEIPPRWTRSAWREEARAQGVLSAFEALREFDPARGVPQSAFLYQRVIASVWNLSRREWALARRVREADPFPDPVVPPSFLLDPELIEQLAPILEKLPEADRGLILQLF